MNRLGLGLTLLRSRNRRFNPATLFSAGEPGIWLEPSDLSTMFQDAAGTVPVTAPGQSVRLRLDKSQGLTLGPEEITNGDNEAALFSTATGPSATRGTLVRSTDLGGAAAKFTGTSSGPVYVNPFGATLFSGSKAVRISFRVYIPSAWVGSGIRVVDTSDGSYLSAYTNTRDQWVSVSVFRPAKGSGWGLGIGDNVAGDRTGLSFYIDDLSIRELPGNHAVATSDTTRGIYGREPFGGRRNLLTWTEQFDNAAWVGTVTATPNVEVAPDGSTTADLLTTQLLSSPNIRQSVALSAGQHTVSFWVKAGTSTSVSFGMFLSGFISGTASIISGPGSISGSSLIVLSGLSTSLWTRVQFTFTATASSPAIYIYPEGTATGTGKTAYVWGAQLELGSTATPYQRVTTAFDVTEAGIPTVHYVQYDGVDDFYQTPTITPNTDKVQVFAGVRKLSDAAINMIAEMGENFNSNNGTFALWNGLNNGGGASYRLASRGTTIAIAEPASVYASPITNVLTGVGDIAGRVSRIRIDGVQVAQTTTTQGTGNFLANPLFIGRRGGTTLPFNGRDYGLIVRFGPNLPDATIQQVERYMAQRNGVTI